MPEELVIVLAVFIGAVWLLVKIGQGTLALVGQLAKSYDAAAAKRKQDRHSRNRDNLRRYVNTVIPDELDEGEKKFRRVRIEFEQAQSLTEWVARPPAWEEKAFQAVVCPVKRSGCIEMCVDEIDTILTPSSHVSTWSYEESQIISRQCRYPFAPPSGYPDRVKLKAFPTLSADLKEAVFKIDTLHINQKDVEQYFADERMSVLTYNNRRADLIAKTIALNSKVDEWNQTNRISWELYVSDTKQMVNAALTAYQKAAELYTKACSKELRYFKQLREGYRNAERQSLIERLGFVFDRIRLPGSIPHTWDIDFDEEQRIAVMDVQLPDVVHRPPYKTVILKSGAVKRALNQSERKELIPKVHPAILLRIAHEVFRNDTDETIELLAVNGWVEFDDPATGLNTKAYTASLMVGREQIAGLNLTKIDPLVAFSNLHGKSAGKLVEIIPIEPALTLNRKDSRFVNAREILKGLGPETNLAAMDWQDFEHLIRELFEKEFSGRGAEVKVTQTSRDRGVDAIVFDPDPIRGGKYVIQAKRYTNTVDVSAVRDLCAVVQKEGASRGILVTTSTYGADAYAFANNEPVTLLNGAELLGLLKKHGYTFRINLQEARRSI